MAAAYGPLLGFLGLPKFNPLSPGKYRRIELVGRGVKVGLATAFFA